MKINTIGGESSNIKITHAKDFKLAEFYMEN
jgi:2-C-methyl-D-erythritol 4-phosphate cytidylyltransferase